MSALSHVTCVDVFGEKHKIAVSELSWRPSAYGVVIRDSKVLLCKHFGKYNLPGGGLDLGEKPEDAVLREVKEETGIDATRPRLLGVESDFFRMSHDGDDAPSYQTLLFYYACEYAGGTLSTDGFDKQEQQYAELAEWVPIEQLDDVAITSSKDFRVFIKQALKEAAR